MSVSVFRRFAETFNFVSSNANFQDACDQSYKRSAIVIYSSTDYKMSFINVSRVVIYNRKLLIRLAAALSSNSNKREQEPSLMPKVRLVGTILLVW